MKLMVKRTIGHFRVLIDHCRRRREPSPEHVLERMVNPLCRDFSHILLKGTSVIEGDVHKFINNFLPIYVRGPS